MGSRPAEPNDRDADTLTTWSSRRDAEAAAAAPCLTLLCHPELDRVGEVASIAAVMHEQVELSRSTPGFSPLEGGSGQPLADRSLSREAARLRCLFPDRIEIAAGDAVRLTVNGEALVGARNFSLSELRAGLVLELSRRVVLLLHVAAAADPGPDLGLIGGSDAIARVRRAIRQVADLDVPVLIRGETGVGKEHVARAIHAASRRRAAACVAVNMAAIPPTTAASELFGHVRGAFTGAAGRRAGFFEQADGGTLFLDEIGETPADVQPMLLRALETGTIQPVGGEAVRTVDVRVVAATDADLDAAQAAGRFRAALRHRLAGFEIHVPPLRERRDDVARLLVAFLRAELAATGELDRLAARAHEDRPYVPAGLMARLVGGDWPGNVRELRNVVRQLVIASRGAHELRVDDAIERLPPVVGRPAPPAPVAAAPAARRRPEDVTDAELLAALSAHRWGLGAAAAALGIPRTTLNDLVERSPSIRRAKDISDDELRRCHADHGGDLAAMADALRVSVRGLRLRLRQLDLR